LAARSGGFQTAVRVSREGQALCFFAGANSIFYGDKLLTAENPAVDSDGALLRQLGLHHEGVEEVAPVADENNAHGVVSVAS
jgi:biotin synthase-like enzyme